MAQAASKRGGAMHPQLRPPVMSSYDDEPSSMSLELFGYHGGGDGAALSLQLAFEDDSCFKHGGASVGDYYGTWAAAGVSGASSSSSSSVLSFEHASGSGGGHHHHHLAYGEDGCALWMDAAAGMVADHPPAQQHGSTCRFGLLSPGSSADGDDAGLHIRQDLGSVQPPAKATNKRARPVIFPCNFCLIIKD